MKKKFSILSIIIITVLFTACFSACGNDTSEESTASENTSEDVTSPADKLYMLRDDSRTIIITLETEPDSEKQWLYEVSDDSLLRLKESSYKTSETKEEEGDADAKMAYVVSFSSPGSESGDVKLSFYYVDDSSEMSESDPDYIFNISIGVDQALKVNSVTK